MLSSRWGLGLRAIQDHFLEVLVMVLHVVSVKNLTFQTDPE